MHCPCSVSLHEWQPLKRRRASAAGHGQAPSGASSCLSLPGQPGTACTAAPGGSAVASSGIHHSGATVLRGAKEGKRQHLGGAEGSSRERAARSSLGSKW